MEGLGFVSRPLGLSAGRGVENAVCRRTSCGPRVARVVRMSMEEEEEEKKNPLAMVQDLISAFQRLVGVEGPSDDSLLYLGEEGFEPLFEEEAPTVLVVGATGEVGRIIVRKLLLRGYKVRVLVRDLFSSTLDLLGTGCGYVMGDVNDMNTLLEAVSGVDKVICALRARDPSEAQEVEMNGVKNLVRAYHDTRHADYGRAEATKLTLFKFEREKDFTRWTTDREDFEPELGRKPASVSLWMSPKKKAVFSGRVFDTYNGHGEMSCRLKQLNMRGFSGFVLRCIGDGKQYRMVLRTGAGDEAGVVYEAIFGTRKEKWMTVRLPLVSFKPRSLRLGGTIARDLEEVDRSDIRKIILEYRKPLTNPERDSGEFCITLDYMKAYRTQDEADFILVSCAKVTETLKQFKAGVKVADPAIAMKWKGEESLRNSGISYCIVRSGQFTEQTGGTKALVLEQNTDVPNKEISRVDVADVCVAALQDPRARNVTFDAYESYYAPTAVSPSRNISNLLEGLRPNS